MSQQIYQITDEIRCVNCLSTDLTAFGCGCQVCGFCQYRYLCAYHFAIEINEYITPFINQEEI